MESIDGVSRADGKHEDNPNGESGSWEDRRSLLARIVAGAIHRLYRGFAGESSPHARAALSRLRRAAGKRPEDDLMAWSELFEQVLPEFPERLLGRGNSPSRSESGAFAAITLYALHQQSQNSNMHKDHRAFAEVMGEFDQRSESKSIKPRFDALLTASTFEAMLYHLRTLIPLLASQQKLGFDTAFDYGQLANDLARLQSPQYRSGILLRWGREFARGYLVQRRDNKVEQQKDFK